ncbi:MAG: hypothetical protein HY340_03550 [Candidatus Kerfeldbacteria bacterium]|nr:hypothetical protein [Candidatus Kerfeldbacteria bacterium]
MAMEREPYIPSPEEIQRAEEFLTADERRLSDQREQAFERSAVSRIEPSLGTVKYGLDRDLLSTEKTMSFAQERGYEPKSEFHVTLIGFRNGKKIREALKRLAPDRQRQTIGRINDLIAETDWTITNAEQQLMHITKDYVVVDQDRQERSRETRESVIQLLQLRGTEIFYQKINEMLGTSLEAPPTHLTLFTKGTDPERSRSGIGIETPSELEQLRPEIFSPEQPHES